MAGKLFTLYTSNANVGGIESVYNLIAQALVERGWQVDMLAKARGEIYESHIPQGVRVVTIGRPVIPSLIKYMASRKPDYVMAAKMDCNVELLICKALYNSSAKAIVRYDGVLHAGYMASRGPKVRRTIGHFLVRRLVKKLHVALALSDGMMESALNTFPNQKNKMRRLYAPIDTRKIMELASEPCDHPWMNDDVPVILHVGRLALEKDISTLLRAFAIARQDRDIRLVVVGIGPEESNLKRESHRLGIAKYVSFVGYVENQYAYMANAQVFAMSSIDEGLGCVMQEAMVCSASIVSTDYTYGARELLAGGKYGVLVPMSDPDALARGMLAALDRPIDTAALQKRAMEFDIDVHIDEMLDIIGETSG